MNKKLSVPLFSARVLSVSVGTALFSGSLLFGTVQAADLSEVYEQAKTYDAEYLTAQYNLDAAGGRIPLAKSAFRPQLTLGAEAGIATISEEKRF